MTSPLHEGDYVKVNFQGKGEWFNAKIDVVRKDGTFNICYETGEHESRVKREHIRRDEDVLGTTTLSKQRNILESYSLYNNQTQEYTNLVHELQGAAILRKLRMAQTGRGAVESVPVPHAFEEVSFAQFSTSAPSKSNKRQQPLRAVVPRTGDSFRSMMFPSLSVEALIRGIPGAAPTTPRGQEEGYLQYDRLEHPSNRPQSAPVSRLHPSPSERGRGRARSRSPASTRRDGDARGSRGRSSSRGSRGRSPSPTTPHRETSTRSSRKKPFLVSLPDNTIRSVFPHEDAPFVPPSPTRIRMSPEGIPIYACASPARVKLTEEQKAREDLIRKRDEHLKRIGDRSFRIGGNSATTPLAYNERGFLVEAWTLAVPKPQPPPPEPKPRGPVFTGQIIEKTKDHVEKVMRKAELSKVHWRPGMLPCSTLAQKRGEAVLPRSAVRRWPEFSLLRSGDVVVTIEHCRGCAMHEFETRHREETYVKMAAAVRLALAECCAQFAVRFSALFKPIDLQADSQGEVIQTRHISLWNPEQPKKTTDEQLLDRVLSLDYPQNRLGAFEVQIAIMASHCGLVEHVLHSKLCSGKWPSKPAILARCARLLKHLRIPKLVNPVPQDSILFNDPSFTFDDNGLPAQIPCTFDATELEVVAWESTDRVLVKTESVSDDHHHVNMQVPVTQEPAQSAD